MEFGSNTRSKLYFIAPYYPVSGSVPFTQHVLLSSNNTHDSVLKLILSYNWTVPFLVLLPVVKGTEPADHSDCTTTPTYQGLFLGGARKSTRGLGVYRCKTEIMRGDLLAGGRPTKYGRYLATTLILHFPRLIIF